MGQGVGIDIHATVIGSAVCPQYCVVIVQLGRTQNGPNQ